jgi:hypothetical protein
MAVLCPSETLSSICKTAFCKSTKQESKFTPLGTPHQVEDISLQTMKDVKVGMKGG